MNRYDVHDLRSGKVEVNLIPREVSELTGIPNNYIWKYASLKTIKESRWSVVFHGEEPAKLGNRNSNIDENGEITKSCFKDGFTKWFKNEWDNLPIIKHYRRGTLQ